MKTLLGILITFFCFSNVFAQDTIQLHQRYVSSGNRCKVGDDFTLSFPVRMNRLKIDSVWIFVPGNSYILSEIQLSKLNNEYSTTFGWSSDNCMNNLGTEFYGIEENNIFYVDESSQLTQVTIFYNGKRQNYPLKYTYTDTNQLLLPNSPFFLKEPLQIGE